MWPFPDPTKRRNRALASIEKLKQDIVTESSSVNAARKDILRLEAEIQRYHAEAKRIGNADNDLYNFLERTSKDKLTRLQNMLTYALVQIKSKNYDIDYEQKEVERWNKKIPVKDVKPAKTQEHSRRGLTHTGSYTPSDYGGYSNQPVVPGHSVHFAGDYSNGPSCVTIGGKEYEVGDQNPYTGATHVREHNPGYGNPADEKTIDSNGNVSQRERYYG